MSIAIVSLCVSILAVGVSATTMWFTLMHRGAVKMVRPSLVAFLDARGNDGPKVWFRALLYSTSRKGQVIESMYVRLRRGEAQQNFSFWVCGERDLASGCGLYVGHTGIALNHHFVLPKDGSRFDFLPGDYSVDVFCSVVDSTALLPLASIPLHLTDEHAKSLKNPEENIYFDWWPDSGRYNAHVVRRRERAELPNLLTDILGGKSVP
jgi:hypothetical protein